jgi:hypothetical protein
LGALFYGFFTNKKYFIEYWTQEEEEGIQKANIQVIEIDRKPVDTGWCKGDMHANNKLWPHM